MQVSDKVRLGDVPQDVYESFQSQLPMPLIGRARHFFSEAARVKEGQKAWESGDISRFGALVTASGNSSIVNYESGSPALISLYEILADMAEVYGARFCGGGFQGCCLALIDPRHRNKIIERLHEKYLSRHPDLASAYSIHICETGGSVVVEDFK
jgi:galactokinase/galacturonokinase